MAPLPPDPYKILGVSKDAQLTEIRSSHRKLVLQCHPDKVQDPKLKADKQTEFQRVQQAYELLTDSEKRQKYDDQVKLEELRRLMKEKANISTPKSSAKYTSEFEIRTTDRGSSAFKSSPSSAKVYTFSRSYDDDYATGGTRIFEARSNRSSKRDPSFAERQSKRESEKEREKDKERDRERRRKEEKKRSDKQRDRDIKRDAEEKYRSRNAKPSVEVFEDEPPKSERKRSSKKHDDKAGRTSPRDEVPIPSPRAPPISNTFYSSTDRNTYDTASKYVQASRGTPGLGRSYSYTTRSPYPPAAPSPPPSNMKKAYLEEDSESEDCVRRSSAAPSRRGSGDGPRISRERSAYRQPSHEVLEDDVHVASSPAARHTASFSRSMPMGSSPPRHEMQLPRVNSMPQPSFARPGPGITRAHTFASDMPRGRDRSRMHAQAPIESESEEEYERERERRYRSRRTASPEHVNPVRYEVDGSRRTHRMPPQMPVGVDPGHGHYLYTQPVRETRAPPVYRESSHAMPPTGRYQTVKTTRYGDVRYSEYPPYNGAVRA
ncbi:DnaJ domain protein [Cordyceps fumosorosea ARSEF 2679]|uniref:DnaJ domain protein n=1 Tax=Cordyceps fumosorosea (strain ARSEF 2679) TaxID=1081104 RepID=A0A168DBS9_CORFA|nr:DnaJ domain protein [Cordyceps fumosorosea ARSEF 2679]OAA72411.1 DnaJ domain protein [Cordyceps fumosorosea ARSEF 2679]